MRFALSGAWLIAWSSMSEKWRVVGDAGGSEGCDCGDGNTGSKTSRQLDQSGGGVTIVENGVVIDCTGRAPFEGYVAVESGRIVEVGEGRLLHGRSESRVIDAKGGCVIPGLIDAHTHHGAIDYDVAEQHRHYHDSYTAIAIARRLTETLQRGFTTVRDAGGADAGFRHAIEVGMVAGPTLLVSGRPLSQTGGHGDMRRPVEQGDPLGLAARIGQIRHVVDGADAVRWAVREELRRGADQIKVMASGGVVSPSDRLKSTQFCVDELKAACEEAQASGTYVMAHAYTPAAIRNCIAAGVRSIEHGNLLDRAVASEMARAGTFLVPTLVAYESSYRRLTSSGAASYQVQKLSEVYDRGRDAIRLALEAGVKIGSGSDLLGPASVNQGHEIALQAEVQGSLGALESATRVNAELLCLDQQVGTLEAGKVADVLVVDGDLTVALDALTNPRSFRCLLHMGEVVVLTARQ